jgi:hypothetical protein
MKSYISFLLMFSFLKVSAQKELEFNKDSLLLFKKPIMPNDSFFNFKREFSSPDINLNEETSNEKFYVRILPLDNMPCLVPKTNYTNKIPVYWPGQSNSQRIIIPKLIPNRK